MKVSVVVCLLFAASLYGSAAERLLKDVVEPTALDGQANNGTPIIPPYEVVEPVGDAELRRYPAGHWVAVPVTSHDFRFMAERGYEFLSNYFNGDNYEKKKLQLTTPMRISFDMWDKKAQRYASFYVSEEEPPAPNLPVVIKKVEEQFIYAIPYNSTFDFKSVCKNVAVGLVDLVLGDEPVHGSCDGDDVYLAMYGFPKTAAGSHKNEFLIARNLPTAYEGFSGAHPRQNHEFV